MSRRALGIGVVSLLLAVTAACSSDGGDSSSSSSDPVGDPGSFSSGPVLEPYEGDGFSMDLPVNWTILSIDDMDFDVLAEQNIVGLDAQIMDQAGALFEQGGKLFALDFTNPMFASNISILEFPRPPFAIDVLETLNVEQMKTVGATDIESSIRSHPAGDAIVIRYRIPAVNSEGVFVLLLTDGAQWAITLSALDVGPLEAAFDQMIESFREVP